MGSYVVRNWDRADNSGMGLLLTGNSTTLQPFPHPTREHLLLNWIVHSRGTSSEFQLLLQEKGETSWLRALLRRAPRHSLWLDDCRVSLLVIRAVHFVQAVCAVLV